jgi:hypothetical protein
MIRTIYAAATLALFGSALAGCGGSVEGTYTLDKAEMKKAMEAEIAKMPADQQGFGKLGLALIEAMDVKLDLKSGGKAEMISTMPSFTKGDKPKTENKTGEWRKEGDKVVIKADKEMSCKAADKKLTCEAAGGKKGEPALVFVRS